MKPIILPAMFFLCVSLTAAETADSLYQTGLTLLQQVANGSGEKTVPAAKAFAEASLIYEKSGNDEGARSANANLYWIKKRMTLDQIEAFVGKGDSNPVTKKVEVVTQPVEANASQEYFDRAEAFAKSSATSYLLISIRYFEVADRFAGSPIAVEAQRRSLDAMQKIKVAGNTVFRPAVPLGIAEAEYKRALTSASTDFDKARKLAADKFSESLTAAQNDATKRGDLEAALKLRQRLKQLQTPLPKTTDELKEFLDETVWDIRAGSLDSPIVYNLTFSKNGTFKRNTGQTAQFQIFNPRQVNLYNYDPAVFGDDYAHFWAFGAGGKYIGTLRK